MNGCISAGLPWLAPCCADCARSRGAAGATGDTPAPSPAIAADSSAGLALLTLGGIFLAVVYGEKILSKLGG
jgi:hypothetical protein